MNDKLDFPSNTDKSIDIKGMVIGYLKYWYWFILGVLICLLVAYMYLRYATQLYQVSTTLLIKDPKGSGADSPFGDLELSKSSRSVNNEIALLKSKTLMMDVVKSLGVQNTFFVEGDIKITEAYGSELPITITIQKLDSTAVGRLIKLNLINNKEFAWNDGTVEKQYAYDKPFTTPLGTFVISAKNQVLKGQKMQIIFNSVANVAKEYNDMLSVTAPVPDANVLLLELKLANSTKGMDILNKLVLLYNSEAIKDKNVILQNTIDFIDERLRFLVSELSDVERDVSNYKQQNSITDVKANAQDYITQSSVYSQRAEDYKLKLNVLNSIQSYVNNRNNDNKTIPSSIGVDDPVLESLVSQYNALQLKKQQALNTVQPGSMLITNMDSEIKNLKSSISGTLKNIEKGFNIAKQDLNQSSNQFKSRIQSVPAVERKLLEIQRTQGIKEGTYAYLLQKREEASISLASTISNSRVIDPAMASTGPVSPQPNKVYLIAFVMGIIVPFGSIYLKDLLNDKVRTFKDVNNLVDLPLLGEIEHNESSNNLIVTANSRNSTSELFRLVRSNLQFVNVEGNNQTIMVTSSMSGEGKTFIALNLGASLALSGKKVVVLEFDIRKPKLIAALGIKTIQKGLTNFIVTPNLSLAELITPVQNFENLYVIAGGPIPPNPSELLLSKHVEALFKELKTMFDYIIVDTAPVGQVSDAFTLNNFVDSTVYVVRYNYTFKEQIQIIKDVYENKKLRNLMIVMNDASPENSKSYGYGYGYGYGYEIGKPKKKKTKLFRK